jgi:hypothetical protein
MSKINFSLPNLDSSVAKPYYFDAAPGGEVMQIRLQERKNDAARCPTHTLCLSKCKIYKMYTFCCGSGNATLI